MSIAIDRAGRVVIPKHLRDALQLVEGTELNVTTDGVGVHLEPVHAGGRLVERNGKITIRSSTSTAVTDGEIFQAIDAGRR